MNKELIERLRSNFPTTQAQFEAADRIEELERDLLNLVCRIHRDGGHYIAAHGEAKAIADADLVVAENNAKLDALQADNARLWEAIRDFLMEWDNCRSSGEWPVRRFAAIREALAATPEQSLARLRN